MQVSQYLGEDPVLSAMTCKSMADAGLDLDVILIMYIGGRKKRAATAEKDCPVSCDGSHPCGYAHAPLIFTAASCQKE